MNTKLSLSLLSLLFVVGLANAEISIKDLPAHTQQALEEVLPAHIQALSMEEALLLFKSRREKLEATAEYQAMTQAVDFLIESNKGNYFVEPGDSSDEDYKVWCDALEKVKQAQALVCELEEFKLVEQMNLYMELKSQQDK